MKLRAAAVCTAYFIVSAVTASGQTGKGPSHFHQWAPTPPMGWNSYDCFSYGVTEQQVRDNADFMASRLKKYGWKYVIVDYVWSAPPVGPGFAPQQDAAFQPRLNMDRYGRLLPDEARFPTARGGKGFRALAAYVHSKGLKFGIHLMRGIPRQAVAANVPVFHSGAHASDAADTKSTCGWLNHMYGINTENPAGQEYLDSIFELYAQWGVDLVKVDDLSYPYHEAEIAGYRKAIDRSKRHIVFSTSPGETPIEAAKHVSANANMWRLLGDLWDDWPGLKHAFEVCHRWDKVTGPGHWPDPDMLPLGRLRKYGPPTGRADSMSALSRDEQRTLVTLWCIARCPLMFGGNLPETDAFTMGLITNPEALAVNQRGQNARQLSRKQDQIVWVADVPGSRDKYVALFNAFDPGSTPVDTSRAAFRSGLVTANTPGQAIDVSVDITGAKRLTLVVDDGGDGFACDHADWAEPRLIGPAGELRLTELKWRRATAGWGKVGINRGVDGNPLVINGAPVSYGIGTHSNSVIDYELPSGYTRFTARAGLDQSGVSQKLGSTVRFFVITSATAAEERPDPKVGVKLADLGFRKPCRIRDLWQRKDLGAFAGEFTPILPMHGAGLYRVAPAP
ncbi:MAG TPA: NPCBM/NEW2 domain-containing protein [Armatimonadota bacterium]